MKLLYISNSDWNLYLFRLALGKRVREAGHEIVMAAPHGRFAEIIERAGFRFRPIRMTRSGFNPIVEPRSIWRIKRMIDEERPDVVHNFTAKGVLYGAAAARLAGAPVVVNSITGLGYMFSSGDLRARTLRPVLKQWYRTALRGSDVIFQNRDDLHFFREKRLVPDERAHLIVSSGVDTEEFARRDEPPLNGADASSRNPPSPTNPPNSARPVVLFAGRMVWMKGVGELVEAARTLRGRARFVLVGDTDEGHPSAIPRETLQQWDDEGIVEWWGHRDDMPHVMAQCHVYCMPTKGREGVPRTLLEAASVGRALIATNSRGCREIVRDGENGLLVPVGDASMLARAIGTLIEDHALRRQMGRTARRIVEAEFSIERIAQETLDVYVGAAQPTPRIAAARPGAAP